MEEGVRAVEHQLQQVTTALKHHQSSLKVTSTPACPGDVPKKLVESSWLEKTVLGIQTIARKLSSEALVEQHKLLITCGSQLSQYLVKKYGYKSYKSNDAPSLDEIEECIETYQREGRQLKLKAIVRPIDSIVTRHINNLT
ncbi:hypothetical protein L914_19535 [Phytophthora nicotianae]|uniref:Uncharacterized protein n=1 Tax=Phytophthora nicotianae TaxID=4792 RepID=W2M9Z2_PHYNI|nr:hypothetical protein L916_19648 [Phytophthora nicotianae]ETM33202.1 hypothetical protein L914_19535 [Phytophthora nicotianae]